MRTSGFGIYSWGVLDLTTTSTLCMFPLSIYPLRTDNGRPVHFSYTVNGTTSTLLYYLVDGIYPRFAFFVSPFPNPTTEVEVTLNRLQKALRKDVERLYAVFTARFPVALHPANYSTVEQVVTVTKAMAILHNMDTEKRRYGYVSRTRMAAGGQAACGGGRRGLGMGTEAPPATPAAAIEERPPPAVVHPPAAIW